MVVAPEPQAMSDVSVVVVTHNSEQVFAKCIEALLSCREVSNVVVVDSASSECSYLEEMRGRDARLQLIFEKSNVGFCRGNNIGYQAVRNACGGFVLFLNPDAFVAPNSLGQLIERLNRPDWADVAACTPRLMGYSMKDDAPTGSIDSAGIGMTFYGKFFDRGQGSTDIAAYSTSGEVQAICGAFLLCRRSALDAVSPNGEVFDKRLYMYKEDIDLSLRLRRAGMRLMYCHDLVAYHCRGWRGSRLEMPRWTIVQSLRNDWLVWRRFWFFLFPNSLALFFYLVAKSLVVAAEVWLLRGLLGQGRR